MTTRRRSLVFLSLSFFSTAACQLAPTEAVGDQSSSQTGADADADASDPGADAAADDATDGGTSASDGATDGPVNYTVSVGGGDGFSFDPPELFIHPGEKVVWTWSAGKHNVVGGRVVDAGGVADESFCSPGGATCADAPLHKAPYSFEHTFAVAGDFPYFCVPHAAMGMTGTIHVRP